MYIYILGFPGVSACNARICIQCRRPRLGKVGKILQRIEWQPAPVLDRGTWQDTVHRVAKETDMTQCLSNSISILPL